MPNLAMLASLFHLVVTAWVAYIAPVLILSGLAGYSGGYSVGARTITYVVLVLGAALLGGTILGRKSVWRGRLLLLASGAWLLAGAVAIPTLVKGSSRALATNDIVAPMAVDWAPIAWAFGLTVGLYVGARFMRPYDQLPEAPNKSLEQEHEG